MMNVSSSGSYPTFPIVQIHKQDIKLKITQDPGKFETELSMPSVTRRTSPLQVRMEQPHGDLQIDQSRAWDALGLGGNLNVMLRIYGNAAQKTQAGIARIIDNGDQMAAVHKSTNVIPEIAARSWRTTPGLTISGPASRLNVDIQYTAKKPKMDVRMAEIHTDVHTNPPRFTHQSASVDIQVLQYPSIRYSSPQIDIRV